MEATDADASKALATAIGDLALDEVATVPLGMFFVRTAFRSGLTGMIEGPAPCPWRIRPL